MVCEINKEIVKNAIIAQIKKELVDSALFQSTGVSNVSPIGTQGQGLIDSINQRYGEDVIKGDFINPSEALVNKHFGELTLAKGAPVPSAINSELPLTNYTPAPSIYSVIYSYLDTEMKDPILNNANNNLKNLIDQTFDELPKAESAIIASIKDDKDRDEKEALIKFLRSVKNSKEDKDKIMSQLQMIFNTSRFLLDLEKQSIEAVKIQDNNKRILALYSIKKTVDSYQNFSQLLGDMYNTFTAEIGHPNNLKPFYAQLNSARSVPQNINDRLVESTKSAVKEIVSDYNVPIATPQLMKINEEIAFLEERLKETNNPKRVKFLQNKIEAKRKDKIEHINSPEAIDKIFKGEYRDANTLSMWTESMIANGHPIVNTIASILQDVAIEIEQNMLDSNNEQQKQKDLLFKPNDISNRDMEKAWSPIMDRVLRTVGVEEKKSDDGTVSYIPKHVSQKTLLGSYSNEYIQKFEEWDQLEKHFVAQSYLLKQDKSKDNTQAIEDFENRLEQVREERKAFKILHSQGKYLSEVYEMWALLDKPITLSDGTVTSVSKFKGDLSNQLQVRQGLLEGTEVPEDREHLTDQLDEIVRQIRELKNPYDKTGQLKTGSDKEISDTLQQFYEKQKIYGDFVITDKQLGMFQADLQILKRKLDNKEISQEEYNRQLSLMARDEIKPEFYDLLKDYSDKITEYSQQLAKIQELAGRLNIKDQLKDNFEKLRLVTLAYRDEDGKIDGIDFENQRPEVKKQIKEIQEVYEKLKSETQKLKGLSVSDYNRVRELESMRSTTPLNPEDQKELDDLLTRQTNAKTIYENNKELIDNYLAAFAELGKLSESGPSHYYYEQQNNIINNLKTDSKIIDQVQATMKTGKFFLREGSKNMEYELIDGRWLKNKENISDINSEVAVESILTQTYAEKALQTSDWWRENHYEAFEWNQGTYKYEPVERPIYIWVQQRPKDIEKWGLKDQPSFRYKKFEIKPEFYNNDFDYLQGYIPTPKPNSPYNTNKRYEDLKNSKDPKEQAYFKYLQFATNKYKEVQKSLPQEKRLGNILPSIIKSTGEHSVEFTQNIRQNLSNLLKVNAGESDEDTQYLLGGSIRKKSEKQVPIRFVNKISGDNQSSNIAGMLLMFELATKKYEKLQEKEPFFKSLQETLKILPVQESRAKGIKLSLRNLGQALKGNVQSETLNKETDNSVLYRTVTNALNMFVYGEMSQDSIINVGPFKIDLNKAASGLMHFASKVTFVGAIASPIKNTLSTGLQTIINSNVQQGLYSTQDFAKAQGITLSHMKDFFEDFRKSGDRSQIGQMLQHFLVLPESLYDEYGKKTQYTDLKEKMTVLSVFKNFSEFEATIKQFLALSISTKVKEGDKNISLYDAYTKKDGQLVLKPNITFPNNLDQKEFEKQFIKKVHYVNRNISGAYREDEKNFASTFTLGKLAMFMNNYFPSMAANRWAGTRYSIETGLTSRGFYRDGLQTFRDSLLQYQLNLKEQWKDMSPRERANSIKFIKELSFIAILSMSIFLLGGDEPKEELRKNTPFYNFAIGTLIGVNNETQAFVDYHDIVRKMQSPFMAVNQIKQIVKTFDTLGLTLLNSDDAYYTRGTGIHDGLHDKGDSKFIANFLKLFGYSSKVLHPEDLISAQNSLSQLR